MAKKSTKLSSASKINLQWYRSPTNFRIILWLIAYSVIRLGSWLLHTSSIGLSIFGFTIVILFGVVYYHKSIWAWYILIIELFLGGAGHYIEIFGLSLRTLLLICFLILWTGEVIFKKRTKKVWPQNFIWYGVLIFGVYLIIPTINGLLNGHGVIPTFQDLLPFAYFALIPASIDILKRHDFKEKIIELGSAMIIGNALFSLITLGLFASGTSILHAPYYKWFRDVTMGKITDMSAGFFRIVTPEQLLAPAILLIATALIIHKTKIRKKLLYIVWISAMIILVLNFSRAYLLGFFIGFIVLKYKTSWQTWAFTGAITVTSFITILIATSAIVSGGQSFGLHLLGVRTASFLQPNQEISTHTRMTLLSPIWEDIQKKPVLGHGLASSVNFEDPFTAEQITTRQFDWGYLELIVELGLIGTLIYISILVLTGKKLFTKTSKLPKRDLGLFVGLNAAFIAIIVIAITSPILSHPLGIVLLVFIISAAIIPISWYKKTEQLIEKVIPDTN